MRRAYNSVVGILLIVAAVLGLVASIGGVVVLGSVHARVDAAVTQNLALIDQALTATDEGLRTASASIQQTQATLTSIGGTINGSASTIDDIVPAIDAVGGIVGTQLPSTIDGATKTLTTFADTAGTIDKVMGLLSSLPFVSIPAYNPQAPLAESVTGFRDSIADLGTKLQSIQSSLDKTATNLRSVQGEVSGVGTALGGLDESLGGAIGVLASYQKIVTDLRVQVDAANRSIASALRWAQIGITFILVWIGIASLGLLTLGWDLFARARQKHEDEPAPVPSEQPLGA